MYAQHVLKVLLLSGILCLTFASVGMTQDSNNNDIPDAGPVFCLEGRPFYLTKSACPAAKIGYLSEQ